MPRWLFCIPSPFVQPWKSCASPCLVLFHTFCCFSPFPSCPPAAPHLWSWCLWKSLAVGSLPRSGTLPKPPSSFSWMKNDRAPPAQKVGKRGDAELGWRAPDCPSLHAVKEEQEHDRQWRRQSCFFFPPLIQSLKCYNLSRSNSLHLYLCSGCKHAEIRTHALGKPLIPALMFLIISTDLVKMIH